MAAHTDNPNEIRITRVYDAPVEAVWDAWTDPAQVAQWWGPRGFTITTHSKDLRVGGEWDYTMHGPDGVDYPNTTKYFEVEPLKRLVYDHGGSKDRPPMFRVTAEFRNIDGKKTELDMRMSFPTPEATRDAKVFIKAAGGNATWDRLAEYLEKELSDKDVFVINRSFEVPVDTMFDLWTKPEHLAHWMGPAGTNTRFIRADIRKGGSSFYSMTGVGDTILLGRADYLDITRPNRLVYTQQFCDENENIARHPMAPTWPAKMLTTVLFTEEGTNQTRVTVRWDVYGDATREEIDTFTAGRAGMTQGWGGSFDKLEDYASTVHATA
jgi:uncharacterized protein YndB with AHSA1/START domain